MDIQKLKGKIVECGLNVEELASHIGMSASTLYRKINSDGDSFSIKEAKAISRVLCLTGDEVNAIFFASFVA